LPLALYVTRLFLDAPTGRRTISVAITYAAIALASFPPILVWVFGFTALYALVAIVLGDGGESRRVRAGLALRWFVVTSLSTGLVGFYYLPALTLREAVPYVVIFYENAAVQSMPLVNAYQLLSPTLAGGVLIYATSAVPTGHSPNIPYVGIVALLTAALADPASGPRGKTLFYSTLIGSVIVLMKLFGIPPVQWAAHLPLLNQIHFATISACRSASSLPFSRRSAWTACFGVRQALDARLLRSRWPSPRLRACGGWFGSSMCSSLRPTATGFVIGDS
jgi:hypothetical protein